MIRPFRDRALRRFFETADPKGLKVQNLKRVERLLMALDDASRPEDMRLPGFGFHALKGDAAGRYALTVTGNWRMTFGWDPPDAIEVDLEDYH